MTNESKSRIAAQYYDALENGLRLLDWEVQKAEHHNFVSTQTPSGMWRLPADGNGHDDTVIGNMLGIAARTQPLRARNLRR